MTATSALITASLIGGFILLVVFVVWFSRRSTERAFAPLRQRFGLAHSTDNRGRRISEQIEGEWQDRQVQIRYEPGGKHDPNRLIFTLIPATPLPVPGFIRVRRKRFIDRIAVAIGLARRLWKYSYRNAGRAFVEAENDLYAEAVVGMTNFRQAVLPLIDYLRPSLTIKADEVSLTLSGPFLFRGRKLQPVHVERVLNQLRLVSELEFPDPELARGTADSEAMEQNDQPTSVHERMRRSPLWIILRPLTLVAAVLLFVGPLLLWWGSLYPPLTWDLHLTGFTAGGAMALIYGALVFPAVRGHSRSLSEFSTLFFFAAVGFPSFFVGVPVVANALMDTAEPAYQEGRITGKRDGKVNIAVTLNDGRTGRVRLKTPDSIYDRARGNEKINIRVMPGALGFPWTPSRQAMSEQLCQK